MASNITFDHLLLEEAINTALKEYVRRHKQLKLIEFFGKVDFASDYDYKSARKRR